ncbi:MAG: fibronectin type III domain-containing protein [Ilumatobacteraceae bacterium]|nr:fibronectin type III domain-containing protein [Ilumatobacteraceae bacterium]
MALIATAASLIGGAIVGGVLVVSASSWDQKGADIDGEAAGDFSGYSVSLSSDGTTVAIGAYRNDGTASDAGHVRVYEWNSGTSSWDQKGSDIDGEAAGDYSGVSVSLSSGGTTVAIGAYRNDGTASSAGHVRVYSTTTSTPTTTTPAASGPRVPGQVPPWPEAIPNVDGTVTVSWAEPFQDGAGPITGYRAVARPQSTPVAQASNTPVSMASGGSCSTTGFVCVIAGLEENVDYLFEVFASNSEGESAGRMTQQAIRIVPQTPATTIPDTVPDTLPAVVDQQPLPVTGNDDDLVTWSLLLIAFGALSVMYVRRTRLN